MMNYCENERYNKMPKKQKKITRALSIRQPYVEQILRGEKVIEYRTIPTNIRERVYIYASKTDGFGDTTNLPKGMIVGSVEITGCDKCTEDTGYYHWLLANPKRLKKPMKPKGKPQPVWFNPF